VIREGEPKAVPGAEVYIRFSGLTYFINGDTTKYTNIYDPDPQNVGLWTTPPPILVMRWILPLGHVGAFGAE